MNKILFSSATDEWATPQELFDKLNKEFKFTLDPCATKENAKCLKFYTKEDDGLSKDWSNNVVFCNPPYGRQLTKWVEKCYKESLKPNTIVVALIPSRTDTLYFHNYLFGKAEIRFLKGRLKFNDSKTPAPVGHLLAVFGYEPKVTTM